MTSVRDQALPLPPHQRLRGASADAPVAVVVDGSVATWPEAERAEAVRRSMVVAEQVGATGPVTVVDGAVGDVLAALADLAEGCEAASLPLVVIRAGLDISPVALLDLFDHPTRGTATLVIDRQVDPDDDGTSTGWPPVRRGVGRKGLVESVRTGDHEVRRPTGVAPGALLVGSADVGEAARLWRRAAQGRWVGSVFGLVLVALTRGGVAVGSVLLLAFTASDRVSMPPAVGSAGPGSAGPGSAGPGSAAPASSAPGPGAPESGAAASSGDADPWRLRMMAAVRPVDGFFSIFVVRKLSRALTWRLLPTGIAPNTITVLSLGVGLLAALACLVGGWPLLVVAAVLLQVSLVLDCVDGEIARYTRRFSSLGAWLDVSGDRLKETGVYAALGLYSYREGHDLWLLAILTMALVSYRHFVDYGFGVPRRQTRQCSEVVLLPLEDPTEGTALAELRPEGGVGQGGGRVGGLVDRADATSANLVVHWAKKALHLPVAERYLVISLGLLTGRPAVVFIILCVLEVIAVLYTTGGRILRSIGGRTPAPTAVGSPVVGGVVWGELDRQNDLGPLARLVLRRPMTGSLAWAVPSTLFAVEAAVVLLLQRAVAPGAGGAAFLFIAAAAYRRYDIIYRTRDLGEPPAPWTAWVTLGVEGRVLLVVVAASWSGVFPPVLLVGGAAIGLFVLAESTAVWIARLRRGAV